MILEMDTKFLFGDCKLVDPNQGNISSSRTFHSRWENVLSKKDKKTSATAFEEEVRNISSKHLLSHSTQFMNDCVSVLFHAKDNSVLGLFVKYQQGQIGNPGNAPFIDVELVHGFSPDVCDVLHSMINQGAGMKECLELLWPV